MLEDIKSLLIIKKVFSVINEKTKLDLIKFNKKLQKKFQLNFLDYKLFNDGYYIIRQGKGIVKGYNRYNEFLYEGEYLNGKKNGYGKEYNPLGQLKFEGEFVKGNRWTGKLYNNYTNNNTYEIKNGNGFVRDEYYYKTGLSIIIYEGQYLNGKKHGKCLEYNKNYYLTFYGEYKNGKKHGKGKEFNNYSIKFDGEYFDGKRWNGKGYDREGNIIYELKNGKGYVIDYFYDGWLKYEGEYLYGERNGKGKEYQGNKLIFDGEYLNGKRHGRGKEYDNDNFLRFEGEYLYDQKIRGKEYLKGKLEYSGDYLFNRKFNGVGFDKYGNIIYRLKNGSGKVKEYHRNGNLIFEGEYLNGQKNGYGKEYNSEGKLIYEGKYLNGLELKPDKMIYFFSLFLSNNKIKNNQKFKKEKKKEYYDKGALRYEGEYLNGKWHGRGKRYKENGKLEFDGEYCNDFPKKGKLYNNFGRLEFDGEYLNGWQKGKEYDVNGKIVFIGEFLLDKKWDGKGYDENGKVIYELKSGTGKVMEYDNGYLKFEGEYLNGEKNGKGKEYENNELVFEGEYLNGKRNGKGKEYNITNGKKFEGEYLNGERNGYGKESYDDDIIYFEGEYLNGKEWNGTGVEIERFWNTKTTVRYENGERIEINKRELVDN